MAQHSFVDSKKQQQNNGSYNILCFVTGMTTIASEMIYSVMVFCNR